MPQPRDISALYREHAGAVARWAGRLGGPGIDVEDVVQDVFLTAHRLLPSFRGEAKITTWLFRITQNQVRHRRRKERWLRLLPGSADNLLDRIAAKGPTPNRESGAAPGGGHTVYQVLDGLNEKYRTAFILFEIEKLSGEEIATMLEQKVATIWVWLHRARAHFLAGLQTLEESEKK